MKTITSVTNPYIKELFELRKNTIKKLKKQFLVDGLDFIEMAYENKCLLTILTTEYLSKYNDVEQIIVSDNIIKKLSPNVNHSSCIGLCKYKENNIINGNKLVYLDGVQDPGNVGTIIRTALAFSYDGLILSSDSASIYNDKVISSSKGALFSLPLFEDIKLQDLKGDYQIISTSLHNAIDYKSVDKKEKFILVLGNEGTGVKDETLLLSDVIVKIDMANIDSLNVGVAGGILLNEYR